MKLPENHLTAEQEKIWEKTLKELTVLYEKLQLTAMPMSMDKIKAIRIPSNIAEESSMPLPWDVQLLLSFDQTLTLAPDDNEFPLLSDASKGIVCSADVLIELLSDISGEEVNSRRAQKVFLEQAAYLAPLIDLPQLGGDELPMLWPILPSGQCSVVLHLETDDHAEFYVKSTSLFNYVLQYLSSSANIPGTIEDTKTDISQLWTEKKDVIILDQIESKLEILNDSLSNMIESMFHKKTPLYDDDNEDDFDEDDEIETQYDDDDEPYEDEDFYDDEADFDDDDDYDDDYYEDDFDEDFDEDL